MWYNLVDDLDCDSDGNTDKDLIEIGAVLVLGDTNASAEIRQSAMNKPESKSDCIIVKEVLIVASDE